MLADLWERINMPGAPRYRAWLVEDIRSAWARRRRVTIAQDTHRGRWTVWFGDAAVDGVAVGAPASLRDLHIIAREVLA